MKSEQMYLFLLFFSFMLLYLFYYNWGLQQWMTKKYKRGVVSLRQSVTMVF